MVLTVIMVNHVTITFKMKDHALVEHGTGLDSLSNEDFQVPH
jgi:hypothetical protein